MAGSCEPGCASATEPSPPTGRPRATLLVEARWTELIGDAARRQRLNRAATQAAGKSRRHRRKRQAYAAKRAAMNLPPPPQGLPRQIKATGSVEGKFVADFGWLMAEWHPTRNILRNPATARAGSGIRVWWQCGRAPDHEWEAQVRSRTIRGTRCPFCTGRTVARSGSIETTHPDIAAQWHPFRNELKRPEQFTHGSHFEAWRQCPRYKSHVWQARISSRTSRLSGCPRCSEKAGRGGRR